MVMHEAYGTTGEITNNTEHEHMYRYRITRQQVAGFNVGDEVLAHEFALQRAAVPATRLTSELQEQASAQAQDTNPNAAHMQQTAGPNGAQAQTPQDIIQSATSSWTARALQHAANAADVHQADTRYQRSRSPRLPTVEAQQRPE